MARAALVRVIALLLVALAASPFTAPFSAHAVCDAQFKDASSADKIAGDVALAARPPALPHAGPSRPVDSARPAPRGVRRQTSSTVLRL